MNFHCSLDPLTPTEQLAYSNCRGVSVALSNFESIKMEPIHLRHVHLRMHLGLIQLNTAPLVPSGEEKDTLVLHVTPTRAVNVTINSSSNSNSSRLNKV